MINTRRLSIVIDKPMPLSIAFPILYAQCSIKLKWQLLVPESMKVLFLFKTDEFPPQVAVDKTDLD